MNLLTNIFRTFAQLLIKAGRWLDKLVLIISDKGIFGTRSVTLKHVQPASGWPGTILTLEGSGFSESLDGNVVEIGGSDALVLRASEINLTVLVGEQATTGFIRVTTGGVMATAPEKFEVLAWPEIRDVASNGSPIFFHGPQNGTPARGKLDQKVLVIFAQAANSPSVNISAEIAVEMATFSKAEQFWREASYATSGSPRATSFKFEAGPWVHLPRSRNFYVWDDADVRWARNDLYFKTKRWVQIIGTRVYCAHQGGGFAIADISVSNGPGEVSRITPGWFSYHVVIKGSTAFIAAGINGLITVDVGGSVPIQLKQIAFGGNLRGCDISGNTLVAAAMAGGVEVYDVSNPSNPIWRAVIDAGDKWATCVKVVGNRAFVGAEKFVRIITSALRRLHS